MEKWMPCKGLELTGGRRGVPGKIDAVPFSTTAPEWLVPRLLETARAAGIEAVERQPYGGLGRVLDNGDIEVDPACKSVRVVWPMNVDVETLERVLDLVTAEARIERRRGS